MASSAPEVIVNLQNISVPACVIRVETVTVKMMQEI